MSPKDWREMSALAVSYEKENGLPPLSVVDFLDVLADAGWRILPPTDDPDARVGHEGPPHEFEPTWCVLCRLDSMAREQTHASNNPNDVKWLDVADAIEESEHTQ